MRQQCRRLSSSGLHAVTPLARAFSLAFSLAELGIGAQRAVGGWGLSFLIAGTPLEAGLWRGLG